MALWTSVALLFLAPLAAPDPQEGEQYRAFTEALGRGDFEATRELAVGFPSGSTAARKVENLGELAAFLERSGGVPAGEPEAAQVHTGALRLALAPDGAFSAALCPETGTGGFRPLLFGWPRAWSSRVSLSIDGEAVMLSPRGGVSAWGNGAGLTTREKDVEVHVALRGSAGRPADPGVVQGATVRIEVTITNRGGVTKTVGARLLLDLVDAFDDAPDVGLGSRHVLATTSTFAGDAVPRTLSLGGDRRLVLRGLGHPAVERVVLAPLEDALVAPFDFAVNPGAPLGADSALTAYLEPIALTPGASRTMAVELVGAGSEFDATPPLATLAWTEPVFDAPDQTRVLLALENTARGVAGIQEDVQIVARPSAGLALVAAADDLERLGNLAPGVFLQRSVLVRTTYESGEPLDVSFDVSARRGAERSSRTTKAVLPNSPAPSITGTIRDVQGRPVGGAEVILRRGGGDVARTTAAGNGAYAFPNVSPGRHEILARRVVHREPAAKTGRADVDNLLYDIVLTSETIGNDGRATLPSVLPGANRDVVLAGSLTRYSLFVSVEWDAPRSYLEGIVRGIRRAAEFLYVATDGHLTYGRVIVADAAENWNGADLYDWANNAVHPNASVAGIRHRFDPVYAPWNTAMNFGRQWAATWDTPGLYSTVVHEFGHYGLGLFDEYLGSPQGTYRGLQYWEMCRCIMGYQYADHKTCWQGNHHAYTNQGMWNGRSCWQQIEEWHEGMRGGFYVPITTPAERGGVVPPEFTSRIGEELVAVIHDHDTRGFDATLQLAGPFGTALDGALVYTDLPDEGRTMYQGATWWNGTMQLMGVHVGDRVRGLKDGARAEFTIDARRSSYTLEFGSEPSSERGPPPLVLVRAEHSGGVRVGASVEVIPLQPPAGQPSLLTRGAVERSIPLEVPDVPGEPRFVGFIPADSQPNGRLLFETVLPDAVRGDVTLVTDAVLTELSAEGDTELASFDGSIRLRVPAGALAAPLPFCIASTAGPPVVTPDAVSTGRLHAVLPSAEGNPFRRPVLVAFRLDGTLPAERLEVRRFDDARGDFVLLPALPSSVPDEIHVELTEPGVLALFERR